MRLPRLTRLAAARRSLVTAVIYLSVAPAFASAATLSGQVIDPDGRPVAGARVVVLTTLGTAAELVTDATGSYEIAGLSNGDYEVRVIVDGFQADPARLTLASEERVESRVQLRVSAFHESIIVSASQIDLPVSRAGDTVTVITAADLRARQIETAGDALRLVPGLSVTRSGGRGAITSLFPRGGGSNYTLVLVDGMRRNAFGGGFDFAHLPVADIDRIEIVRGPQSALFGSDAIGAVIQIVTRRGGAPRAHGLVEGGSQGTTRAAAGAAGSHGNWTWGGAVERTASDGFTGRAANGESVTNDDDELRHASGTLGWRRPDGADLLVTANISRDERGFPGPFGSDPIGVFAGVDRVSRGVNDTRQIGARIGHRWTTKLRQRLEANYTDLSGDFVSAFGPSTSGTRRFDARIQEDATLTSNLGASAGIEMLRERGTSTYIVGPGGPIPIDRSVTGTFGELRWTAADRLFMAGGVRVEHLSRESLAPDPNPFSPRPTFPDQHTNSWNPKIAASYLVTSPGQTRRATRIRASAGTGIRPPNAFEIAFTDNPGLAPERSRSADVGVEQQWAGGAFVAAATMFFNRYDDLIVTVGRSLRDASRYRTDNISNARARGVEVSAGARLPRGFGLRGTYTFLPTEILSADGLDRLAPAPFKVGDALLRRPRHQGTVEGTFAVARFSAFAGVTLRSRILDVEPNFGSFGGLFFSNGYSVLDAGVSVPVGKGVEIFARGSNLTDRAYEETLGYPALGRSVMAGARVAAGR